MVCVDLFCGAGGESTGLMRAAGSLGLDINLFAVNHWCLALETHAANHPSAVHFCEDVETLKPSSIKHSRVALLWASPECTHHSVALGGKPRDSQSRATAWAVCKWAQELCVERIIVENVPEFLKWGPLDEEGRRIKKLEGSMFQAWTRVLQCLGYRVEWRLINAADYGDPTTRTRLFVQAARGGRAVVWPSPTHSRDGLSLPRWRPVSGCIDWGDRGESIFERKRPLKPNTLARIENGLSRFGAAAEPYMILLNGGGAMRFAKPVTDPAPVVTAGGKHIGLVRPFITKYYGSSKGSRPVSSPLDTVTTKARFGLARPEDGDIFFRMLRSRELSLAQGFPSDYKFRGTDTQITKQIGNAVPVGVATALCLSVLSESLKGVI